MLKKKSKLQVSCKNTNRTFLLPVKIPTEGDLRSARGRGSRCPAKAQLLILVSTPANWLGPDLLPEEYIARAAVSNIYFYFLY